MSDVYDPELDLLGDDAQQNESAGSAHAFRTAPVFTGDAFGLVGSQVLPQRALYGRVLAQRAPGFSAPPVSPKLYINTNAPFSALVCGVQVGCVTCQVSFASDLISGIRKEPLDVSAPGELLDG